MSYKGFFCVLLTLSLFSLTACGGSDNSKKSEFEDAYTDVSDSNNDEPTFIDEDLDISLEENNYKPIPDEIKEILNQEEEKKEGANLGPINGDNNGVIIVDNSGNLKPNEPEDLENISKPTDNDSKIDESNKKEETIVDNDITEIEENKEKDSIDESQMDNSLETHKDQTEPLENGSNEQGSSENITEESEFTEESESTEDKINYLQLRVELKNMVYKNALVCMDLNLDYKCDEEDEYSEITNDEGYVIFNYDADKIANYDELGFFVTIRANETLKLSDGEFKPSENDVFLYVYSTPEYIKTYEGDPAVDENGIPILYVDYLTTFAYRMLSTRRDNPDYESKYGSLFDIYRVSYRDLYDGVTNSKCGALDFVNSNNKCKIILNKVIESTNILPTVASDFDERFDDRKFLNIIKRLSNSSYYFLTVFNDEEDVIVANVLYDVYGIKSPKCTINYEDISEPNIDIKADIDFLNVSLSNSGINENEDNLSYTWFFGDVKNKTSDEKFTNFLYTTPGIYTVGLNVFDGEYTFNKKQKVAVYKDISFLATTCTDKLYSQLGPKYTLFAIDKYIAVKIVDWDPLKCSNLYNYDDKKLEYSIDIGDGEIHKFTYDEPYLLKVPESGTYNVKITASNGAGFSESKTETVIIGDTTEFIEDEYEIIQSANTSSTSLVYQSYGITLKPIPNTSLIERCLWLLKDENNNIVDFSFYDSKYNSSSCIFNIPPHYELQDYYVEFYAINSYGEFFKNEYIYHNDLYNKFSFYEPGFICYPAFKLATKNTECLVTSMYPEGVKSGHLVYQFDFGDNETSALKSYLIDEKNNNAVTHNYSRSGYYFVTLTISFSETKKVIYQKTKPIYIKVRDNL
ncbi:MAG: PKD domain-containing protein [Succinivibrionaceae bacterium]